MSDGHTTATQNDYTVTFHPAFASRCVVKHGNDECEVYKQKDTHHFQNGETHPKKHKIRLQGGKYKRDVTLEIDDPNQSVAGVTVHLYGDDHVAGMAAGSAPVETFSVDNDVSTCPPNCSPGITIQ